MGIDNLNELKLLHAFIWGIKDQICTEVHLGNPKHIEKAICMVLDFNEFLYHPRYP